MTSSVLTTLVAISALGLAATPISRTRPLAAAALSLVGGGPPDSLVVNPAASSIRWKGAGLGGPGMREGSVALASGLFVIRHERLTSGSFGIDLRPLEGTLRSARYFDVARNPTASFRSSGAVRVGPATWRVTGDLTMRGLTRPIAFDASVQWVELGHMVATSSFTIDRRQWGIGGEVAGDRTDGDIQVSLTMDARRKPASVATR